MSNPNDIAIEALKQAVSIAPQNAELAAHLAGTLSSLGRYSEACDVLRKSLETLPGNIQLQITLAETFFKDGQVSHALAIAETLAGANKENANVQLLYAKLLQADGDPSQATDKYRLAIELDPEIKDPALESLLGLDQFQEEQSEGRIPISFDGPEISEDDFEESAIEMEKPSTNFANVGGMESVKEDVRVKIIYPLQHADMYAAYGKKIGGGILLYGPPGCGKTLMARATAGEVQARFLSVGISDVLDMWIGGSEKNLHQLFQQARRSKPCVVFFDEVDALGASRSDMRKSGGRHLINQFLSELDGVEEDNDGLLFLAATNAPWHLDSAFRRPGRFDKIIFVPPPDKEARQEILKIALENKPCESIDYGKVAAKMQHFSGADISAVVDQTIEEKLKEAVKTGLPKPITTKDLIRTTKLVRPSTSEWFSAARNHALYSNESGAYDPILEYLGIKK